MINVEQGLSNNVMYPLLLEYGSCNYFTKDGVIAYKEKLDKKLKRYGMLNGIKWGLFCVFTIYLIGYIMFCCLLSSRIDIDTYHTITGFLQLPTIIIAPLLVWIPRIHFIDNHHMFLFKKFKEMYGEYFELPKRWNNICRKCTLWFKGKYYKSYNILNT